MEIRIGDIVEIAVESTASGGEGVGRIADGRAAFVRFALPSEAVRARIFRTRTGHVNAELLEVLIPSKDRVNPACPLFGRCGGCDLQHMSAAAQAEFKTTKVRDALRRIGGVAADVQPCVMGGNTFRYRNKCQIHTQVYPGGAAVAGFYSINSHDIVPAGDCLLMPEWYRGAVAAFKEYAAAHPDGAGAVRNIQVREGGGTLIVTAEYAVGTRVANLPALYSALCAALPEYKIGLYGGHQAPGGDPYTQAHRFIAGEKGATANICGLSVTVGPHSFLQVNPEICQRLYDDVLGLGFTAADTVVDAYAGAGVMSALIARTGAQVIGVEIVPEATEAANRLMREHNLTNTRFINGDCDRTLQPLLTGLRRDTDRINRERAGADAAAARLTVVLDPPRAGCSKAVINALAAAQPDRIIYISCDPATLARDIKRLFEETAETYEITQVRPYDMFPQTANVETLVCLSSRATSSPL